MLISSLEAVISADTSGLTASLARAEVGLRQFASSTEQQTGKAATTFAANVNAMGQAANRYIDAAGRLRESNGRFVSSATLAAEAAGNVGGAALRASADLRQFSKAGESLKDLGSTLSVGVTAPILLFGGAAVSAAGDFESAFNRVEAATQASGKELDALRQKAEDIAIDPKLKFSASDAASALENLAKNGLNATQILGGAADAAVNLATATGGQLATSADIATDVMNNFNLSAKDLVASVNNITGTTIASKLDIDNYRLALGQAGGVAGQLGVQFQDFNTALAVTSSGFSSGSDAGTSFKTFLQRLVPQSKEAAKAMEKLGLEFFDAQGKIRPLRDIAGELQKAFAGLSDQDKNKFGTEIFGADSIRTALLLAKDGTAGFDAMAESIGKVNAASQGGILSKGFNGALEAAKSALEGFQIALGRSGLLDLGTRFLQGAGGLFSGLAKLDPAVLRTGTALAAAAAAIGPLLGGIGALGVAIPALVTGFGTVGAVVGLAAGPFALLVGAVGVATVGIISHWSEIASYFNGPDGQVFREIARSVGEAVDGIKVAFNELGNSVSLGGLISASGIVNTVVQEIGTGVVAILDTVNGLVRTVSGLLEGDWAKAWDGAKQAVNGLFGPLANLLGLDYGKFREMLGIVGDKPQGTGLSDYFLGLTNNAFKTEQALGEVVVTAGQLGTIPPMKPVISEADIKAAEAMAEALSKLRASLELNNKLSQALGQDTNLVAVGNDYDYIQGRVKALEGGITSLLSAGFRPQSVEVQKAVKELQFLKRSYDDLSKIELKLPAGVSAPKVETPKVAFAVDYGKLPTSLAFDDSFAVKAEEAAARYRAALASLTPAQRSALQAQADFNTQFEELVDTLPSSIGAAAGSIAGVFAESFGQVIAGTVSFGEGMQAAFKGALGIVADFAGQFGQQMVALGIAKVLADKFAFVPGPAMIAAGLGLIAVAGVTKALISKGPALGSGGGGSVGASAAPPRSVAPNPVVRQETRGQVNTTYVTLAVNGRSIAEVVKIETDRLGRVIGVRQGG